MVIEQTSIDITPLISRSKDACTECWGCVRCCPVKAIRVDAGHLEVVQEKCVACGLCVAACSRAGHVVRDDTPAVLALLRSRRPVIALLASEFVAALHPMTVGQVERALETLGFWAIETTLLGEEIVAEAYEQLHLREDSLLSLRSTCPVVVEFVRKFYPALVPALAPVVPPYIAQARLIHEVYAADAAIVYVSPCYARKDEFRDPQFGGVVDAVIDFAELKRLIDSAEDGPVRAPATMPSAPRPSVSKEISLTDGFPRQTLVSRDRTDASVHVVRGLSDLDRLLRALLAGEVGPTIIDMLNCDGCIDGPAVGPGISLFAKRNIEAAARHRPGPTHVSTRAMLAVLPSVPTVRSFSADPVAVWEPTCEQIDEVLAAGRLTRNSALDCGACGWALCVEHATAICRSESSWDLCLPLQRALFDEQRSVLDANTEALHEAQTLDAASGVWNKRAFAERLDAELARHARYGSPTALALIGIDGFAQAAEALGNSGGDHLLAAVAARMSQCLRTTDFVARWAGDEFAVILPGIGKTAAFAVAEKLRTAVRATPYSIAVGGYTREVSTTCSVGVAAASPSADDACALLEAADTALHAAVDAGKDRVHLAPG